MLSLHTAGPQHRVLFDALLGPPAGEPGQAEATTEATAKCFGVDSSGRLMDRGSLYRVPKVITQQDRLCFDVSNNRLAASVNAHGLLERCAVQLGVAPVESKATPVGAYVEKIVLRGGPWPWLVSFDGEDFVRLDELPQPVIRLEDNLIPRYEWRHAAITLVMRVFVAQSAAERPAALCVAFTVEGSKAVRVKPQACQTAADGSDLRMLCDRGAGWGELHEGQVISLDTGAGASVTAALVLGGDAMAMERQTAGLKRRSAVAWADATRSWHRGRYGRLEIPAAPFYAALYERAGELTRQSLMLDLQGGFGGSFNGSDLPPANNVWMRDCFYSTLPQSWLAPELCEAAIPFFLKWGIPLRPLGEHADKFPAASGVTNSLGNSVAGIVLAGEYWRHQANAEFFKSHPEILSLSVAILEQVLASRREDVFLFPSIYVSDGESRGDFHTGSNIFLWRAFVAVARLAAEVFVREDLADQWSAHALRLRSAILANCIGKEGGNERFVEGSMQDHTTISGHDGEESDVTLAAFYDFCAADDPHYLNAAKYAISSANPYAIAAVQGIWWYAHGRWSSATFPGWMTALASASSEAEMLERLERIRTLTDGDGSFWWWPFPHDAPLGFDRPLRTNSKCGWAAGVYLALFTSRVLGLRPDGPRREITFSPFVPWDEFSWTGCRLGAIVCDVRYQRRDGLLLLTLRNRSSFPVQVHLRGILPEGTHPDGADLIDGTMMSSLYGRSVAGRSRLVSTGEELRLSIRYRRR
jgi:hypothetical protein